MRIVLYTFIFEFLYVVLADVSLRKGRKATKQNETKGHLKVHTADITTQHGGRDSHMEPQLEVQPKYCSDPNCETCQQDNANPEQVHCTKCSPGFGLKHDVKECDDLLNCENFCTPCKVEGCALCSTQAATCASCDDKLTLQDGKCTQGWINWDWMPTVSNPPAKAAKRAGEETVKGGKGAYSAYPVDPYLPLHSMGVTSWAIFGLAAVLYLVLALAIAFCYMQIKGPRLSPASGYLPEDGFSDAICECSPNWTICIWACCCPCIRWSDTLSQMPPNVSVYLGVLVWCCLMLFNSLYAGLGFLFLVIMGSFQRGRIRAHFGLPRSCMTGFQDVIAWMCCQPCAIAQEARHVERALGLTTNSQR